MKNILVTGGAGAIGSNLVNDLAKVKERRIIVIDNLKSGRMKNIRKSENIIFLEGDILDKETLKKAFSHNIDTVFHMAAFFANQNSVEHPVEDLEVNGKGTLMLLMTAEKNKVSKFIYASTSCIYGNKESEMKEEDISSQLDTPYAISKLLGEFYTRYFNRLYNLPIVILRYFNSYGPGDYPGLYKGVIPNFIKNALEGKPLEIKGIGEETRAFTYIEDVIRGTILAAVKEEAVGEIINIGTDKEIKIIELAKKINMLAGNKSEIVFTKPREWDHIKKRKASLEKARKLLGYAPKIDIDEGLRITFNWAKKKF